MRESGNQRGSIVGIDRRIDMSTPRVAILIPCLNAIHTIEACIDSALQQSYDLIHVHVQDGGSTDGTLDILAKYNSQRFSFTTTPDGGIYDAINKALDQIDADWYYILGSDDALSGLDAVASVMTYGKQDISLLYGDVRYGKRTNALIPDIHRSRFDHSLWWKNSLHQQGTFYHRTILQPHRFDSRYRVLADYDLHLQLLQQGVSAKHTGMTLSHCSADGLSKQFNMALYREELRIKWRRLPFWIYALNIPWVMLKWTAKKLF